MSQRKKLRTKQIAIKFKPEEKRLILDTLAYLKDRTPGKLKLATYIRTCALECSEDILEKALPL
jgi:hypothetical protein